MSKYVAVLLVVVGLSRPGPARADDERSVGWAYAIGAAGVLVPAWAGLAVMPKDDDGLRWNARSVAAMTGMYASLAWGTQTGYLYSGNTRYALWGGVGKTGLLGAGLAAHRVFEAEARHPYLLASTVMVLTLWSAADYVLLYRDVRRQNERRAEAGVLTAAPTISRSGLTVSVGGRF
jgi:hypothetical protein